MPPSILVRTSIFRPAGGIPKALPPHFPPMTLLGTNVRVHDGLELPLARLAPSLLIGTNRLGNPEPLSASLSLRFLHRVV